MPGRARMSEARGQPEAAAMWSVSPHHQEPRIEYVPMRHPFVESKPVVSSVLVADGTVHCRFMDIVDQKLCGDGKIMNC